MIRKLTAAQAAWVETTLDGLSLEQCAAQLLCVSQFRMSDDDWYRLIEEQQIGSMRARAESAHVYRDLLVEAQKRSPIPMLVPSNMEAGAAELRGGYGTEFPWMMGAGAANSAELMARRGEAIATEARYIGVNWVFNPVVDINFNFDNPITNIRAISDDPERVSRLAVALLQSLQAHGLAATAKHFPGDGIDDRDQHLLTSINSMPLDQWMETYGSVWKAVIGAGVMCIMPGHISLPDYQGYAHDPEAAPPATLDRALLIRLLREELGFAGMVVSDNASMIGLTSHTTPETQAVRCIASGIDMYLNADPLHDRDRIVQAVRDGTLSEERVHTAARRVLEMKARLNLTESAFGPEPTAEQTAAFQASAQAMADQSLTFVRGGDLPLPTVMKGTKVLTVTYGQLNPLFGMTDLEAFDQALRERGAVVEHLLNPESMALRKAVAEHDVVFVNLYQTPMMTLGSIRTTASMRSWGWRSLFKQHPAVAYTTFGNPYLGYEIPHVPQLLATYGGAAASQIAAVKVWLGEIDAVGSLPVKLPQVTIKPWPMA